LGSDYGGDYAENHHLRSSSLYDVFLSGPPATSRPATPPPLPRDTQILSDEEPQISKPPQDLDKTPQKPSFKATHQQRLSDTIRARTHYWVDRRFHNTAPIGRLRSLYGPEARDSSFKGPVSVSKPTLAQAAVQTLPYDAEEQNLVLVKVDDVPEQQIASEIAKPKKSRVMKVVIEIWLWMQFVVIIMVFLWAVTMRGPRSVLRNTSRTAKRVE
jgi:hypothetical protein